MARLTRDGTAEPVSRDQILRDVRGQGNIHFLCSKFIFPVQLTTVRIGNLTRLIHSLLCVMTIHIIILFFIACVLSSHLFWTSGPWTYQPGSHRRKVTQDRITPFLSLVDREVEFCVLMNN